ncbi:MAG: acyl-CoA dehydrogenase [Acidimicrobiia bacterium]|nr:MAG: acyl-CoA dehydrogenase [Acidimicrobiia bacterium]
MDFTPTEHQTLLRETLRKLLERECPAALVRAHVDDPGVHEPLWTHLREYVALGTGPATDCCLALEETGHAAAPGPFLATVGLYTPLTGDETPGTVAIAGSAGEWLPNDEPVKTFVLEADRVERIAVVCPGPAVAVIERPGPERLRPVATVDFSRRVFELDTTGLALEARPLERGAFDRWRARAYASIAAEMVGTARRILGMALDHARHRHQFGVPIGSFQAIQHKLADMSLALERATAAVHYAAMTVDAGHPDLLRAAHAAKAAAGDAARRILKDGIQIHGGIGYTWEHDLHLYLRRATADEYLLGTTGWHLDRLADLLFA